MIRVAFIGGHVMYEVYEALIYSHEELFFGTCTLHLDSQYQQLNNSP
jgi:hypothetical protein